MTHKWPISSFVQRLDHFNGPSIHSESPAESCSPPRSIQVMPWISIDLSESVPLKIQLALAHTVIAASPQYESERGGAIAARSAEALARLSRVHLVELRYAAASLAVLCSELHTELPVCPSRSSTLPFSGLPLVCRRGPVRVRTPYIIALHPGPCPTAPQSQGISVCMCAPLMPARMCSRPSTSVCISVCRSRQRGPRSTLSTALHDIRVSPAPGPGLNHPIQPNRNVLFLTAGKVKK